MTRLYRQIVLLLATLVGLGLSADRAGAAVFTVNIFDLQNNRRVGEVITVTVTAIDAGNNIVVNPNVNFDGDAMGGVLTITTQKDVTAGRTVVTVNDARVSSVTFTFTGDDVVGTVDQRLRNVNNLDYEVAVPRRAQEVQCCPPSKSHWWHRFLRR
jgi:hypothetical protein